MEMKWFKNLGPGTGIDSYIKGKKRRLGKDSQHGQRSTVRIKAG